MLFIEDATRQPPPWSAQDGSSFTGGLGNPMAFLDLSLFI